MIARLRRPTAAFITALGLLTATTATPALAAATPRANYTQIVNDVMCVVCHEPLAVAQSPEAFQERQYIRTLIAQGMTRTQIENALVESYGVAVLAVPPAHGFNLLVYVVPPVVLIIGIVTVAVTLPRWRRSRAGTLTATGAGTSLSLDPADAARLEADLGRHL